MCKGFEEVNVLSSCLYLQATILAFNFLMFPLGPDLKIHFVNIKAFTFGKSTKSTMCYYFV